MKNARVNPRWVDYMHPRNPHGLRFIEGDPVSTDHPTHDGNPSPDGNPKPEPKSAKGEGEGEGDWKSRFEGQQKVNRDLERKLNELRDGLASALGVEGKPTTSTDDLVTTLQQQVAQMQRETLVSAIAREHEVTAADDIALISEAQSEDGMRRIASRLKAQADAADASNTPKPDRTQGGNGGQVQPEAQPGVPRMAQAIEAELAQSIR